VSARDRIRRIWAEQATAHPPTLRAEKDGSTGRLYLYDVIDSWFGVTAKDLVAALDELGDVETVELHINSPGGDVFDAIAFLNSLRQHPARVVAWVDGIAASAASFIAAGSDELVMSANSQLFIHDAWGLCIGNAADMDTMSELLSRQSDNIAGIYAAKAGNDASTWRQTMRDETWMSDAEALESGLADRIETPASAAAALSDRARITSMIPTEHAPAAKVAASLTPKGSTVTTTTAPAPATDPPAPPVPAVNAGIPPALVTPDEPASTIRNMSLDQLYAALTQRHNGRATPEIHDVLTDITQGGMGIDTEQPAFVGELWDGVRYQRKIVPLVGQAKLTSYKVTGWQWVVKPVVAAWTGDKAAVPSNTVDTAPVSGSASRLAGAHDIDRKYRDFGDTEFFKSYYEAMTESYARLSDTALVTGLVAAGTAQTATHAGLFGGIADGVAAMQDETDLESTFVLINNATLLTLLLPLTNFDLPAYLEMMGVNVSRIRTHASVPVGKVIVGTKSGVDFYELPGSPIRVEAIDMVKGGVDAGVFGYYYTLIHKATALRAVTLI
jgi:ATP-dependent protease ClpP protease subunit